MNSEDKRLALAAIGRNYNTLSQGFVYKGNRWMIGPNVMNKNTAFYIKDLTKGPHSYQLCKPKDQNHMNFNNIDAWHWYH